ncbi:phosphonopyruvate decarboxylase [Streptomyces sp. WMMC1477]|uniref:phosphonopyruvate decarboxylase n=1 Tax=Streptomyces sp. WMMC1477 TaxID=3015155 RepID=UPI0022B6FA16|nr:phosphonopyruvate decarboxylase [Streptomyces sp. WMMC1477]MCZ7431128.1 phosphonopyruvate decarboxylase [Streptomyces sp. WMMC1477]
MIAAEDFCAALDDRGFRFASGVPCSFFGGPIAHLSRSPGRYVPAANEGGALATAAGAALAGRRAYVMLQNSGLGNLINPLTSLVMTYRIPVLSFVSLRGWPDPAQDEPQHEVMGTKTVSLLETLGLPYWMLRADCDEAGLAEILTGVEKAVAAGEAPFVLVEKGSVGKCQTAATDEPERLDSRDAVQLVTELAGDSPIVATTGYTGRELFGVADRPANFYMQGSMGHAAAIALGVAMADPGRSVVVLDGDGAALMHMGTLSAIAEQAPGNLIHVVLDNGIHESTGGQSTTSSSTRLDEVAVASGYRTAARCRTLDEAREQFTAAQRSPGPHLLLIPTRPRTGPMPPRATSTHSPEEMRDRFAAALTATTSRA